MENQIVIKKSNPFARAKWKPKSIWEGRILALAILNVQENEEIKTCRIQISDLLKGTGERRSGKVIKQIEKALEDVISRKIKIYNGPNDITFLTIFRMCRINSNSVKEGGGYIDVLLEDYLKRHFIDLLKDFTLHKLEEYLRLSSTYSQKMYEYLSSWKNYDAPIRVELNDLHNMLNVPDSMKTNYAEFKRRVLKHSHEEITSYKFKSFDFRWYEETKRTNQGRPKVIAIHFNIWIPAIETEAEINEQSHGSQVTLEDKEKIKKNKGIRKKRKSAVDSHENDGLNYQPTLPFDKTNENNADDVFSPEVAITVKRWLEHKKEIKREYKPTARQALLDEVRIMVEKYEDEAVINVINYSMSNNYDGIIWDKIDKKAVKKNLLKKQNDVIDNQLELELELDKKSIKCFEHIGFTLDANDEKNDCLENSWDTHNIPKEVCNYCKEYGAHAKRATAKEVKHNA